MKLIPYTVVNPPNTTNKYWRMTGPDRSFVLDLCRGVVQLAPHIMRFNIAHPKYLKQQTGGNNTAATLCEGILENFITSQNDISEKQCIALVDVFKIGNEEIEDFDIVEFSEVPKLPKLKLPTIQTEQAGTTMSDLFDIESITVTYKRGD